MREYLPGMWKFARSCTVAAVFSGYHAHTRRFAAQMTKPSKSFRWRLIQNGRMNRCHSIDSTARRVHLGAKTRLGLVPRLGTRAPRLAFRLSPDVSPPASSGSHSSVNSCPCAASSRTTSRT